MTIALVVLAAVAVYALFKYFSRGPEKTCACSMDVRKQSFVDDRLFSDLLCSPGGVTFVDDLAFPKAKTRRITAIEALVPYDNKQKGVERWTVQRDNKDSSAYLVELIPDGQGGTIFAVKAEDARHCRPPRRSSERLPAASCGK